MRFGKFEDRQSLANVHIGTDNTLSMNKKIERKCKLICIVNKNVTRRLLSGL